MRIRPILVSAVTAVMMSTLFVAAAAAPAMAQDYGGGTLTIEDPTLEAGGPFTINGTGCLADATVTVAFDGEPIGTTTADADGAFAYTGTVPAGTAPGDYALTATCGDLVQSLQVTVSAQATGGTDPATGGATPQPGTSPADPPSSGGALPRTGTDVGSLLRWAVALVLAGAGLVLLARNRHLARRPA